MRDDILHTSVCLQDVISGRWVRVPPGAAAVDWQRAFNDATVFKDAETAIRRMRELGIDVYTLIAVAARA